MLGKDHRRRQMEMKCDFHKEVNLSAISSSRRSSRSFQKGCNDGLPTPFEPCELGPNTGGTSKASNPRSIVPVRWRAQCVQTIIRVSLPQTTRFLRAFNVVCYRSTRTFHIYTSRGEPYLYLPRLLLLLHNSNLPTLTPSPPES
jgi:hypothetical protein